MEERENESVELDPFTLSADLSLEFEDTEKPSLVERGGNCNTARGQAGTRWS